MSRWLKYMAANPHAQTLGGPTGRVPVFPFDYGTGGTPGSGGGTIYHQAQFAFTEAHRLWWRLSNVSLSAGIVGAGPDPANVVVPLARILPIALPVPQDEEQLMYPGVNAADTFLSPMDGAFEFRGSEVSNPEWNGHPEATMTASFQMDFFRKWRSSATATNVAHMIWTANGALIWPSLYLAGNLTFDTPFGEYTYSFSTEEPEAPTESRSFTATVFGEEVDMFFWGTSLSEVDASLSVLRVGEYNHGGAPLPP